MKVKIENGIVLIAWIYYSTLIIIPCYGGSSLINRSSFPADFLFGTASSAYQYEGAAHIEGRQPSIWDTFAINQPAKILDHSNGNVADNFYFRYKEDIALMKQLGFDSFRFSISWSRILPQGKISGGVNQQGVDFYNNLINELISHDIVPFVTLFHWDNPQALEDEYGGFLSPKIMFFDPITYGSYPKSMQNLVGNRLPKFTKSQSKMVKGSIDFLGLNYYTANYADEVTSFSNTNLSYTTDNRVNRTREKNGIPIGESMGSNWLYIYPKGIRELLLYIKKKYNPPPIYITENGVGDVRSSSWPINYALNDTVRVNYHKHHLSYLLEAIKEGVEVRGYFAWSFLDNFEWEDGYTTRFGTVYVDYKDGLKRYLKNSALWFQNFLRKQHSSSLKLYCDQ